MPIEIIGAESPMTADEALLATGRRERRFGHGSAPWPYRTHRPRLPGEYPEISGDSRYVGTRNRTLGGSPEFGGWFSNITKTVSRGVKRAASDVYSVTPVGIVHHAVTKGPAAALKGAIKYTPLGIAHTAATKGPSAAIVSASPVLRTASYITGSRPSATVKTARNIATNPMVRVGAAGAAFVFPPVGVPLAAGVEMANALASATRSVDAKKRQAAAKTVLRTAAAARKGDADAKRGLRLLAQAKKMRKLKKGEVRLSFIIGPSGRIFRDKTV